MLLLCANSKTMRLKGRVGNCGVVILIDIGSTHNFVDPTFITRARLGMKTQEKGSGQGGKWATDGQLRKN